MRKIGYRIATALVSLVPRFLAVFVGVLFVTRLAAAEPLPALQWESRVFSEDDEIAIDVVVGANESVFLAGYTYGDMMGQNHGGADAFISKFGTDGSLVWTRQLGTTSDDFGNAVVADLHGGAT